MLEYLHAAPRLTGAGSNGAHFGENILSYKRDAPNGAHTNITGKFIINKLQEYFHGPKQILLPNKYRIFLMKDSNKKIVTCRS
jgi:hypothetical protein